MKDYLEKEFIAFSRRQDRLAYTELARAYSAHVFAICFGILCNRADAQKAAQQVFLKGFVEIKKLGSEEQFAAWIGQVARNYCSDILLGREPGRQSLVRPTDGQDAEQGEGIREYPELEAALKQLPEEYRLCLMLYYFDGRSVKNVAESLQISEEAVHARMSQARIKLRQVLVGKEES